MSHHKFFNTRTYVHGKKNFVEISKNLATYRK